jgi:hypothetical protein
MRAGVDIPASEDQQRPKEDLVAGEPDGADDHTRS